MNQILAEFVGTMVLMMLGNGVVCNVLLARTKGNGSGWIVITAGWGFAVFAAVAVAGPYSGAHINPAVTLGLAIAGTFPWASVLPFMAAQFAGAFLGTTLAFLAYYKHYQATDDQAATLGTFCNSPAINSPFWNMVTEVIATFALVFVVLYFSLEGKATIGNEDIPIGLGSIGAIPVGLLVFGVGLSLGGPTGYAINPARDLSPRIAHALLPIPNKGPSGWSYSWIPVAGPMLGGAIAAAIWLFIGQLG
ncbi:MAG: MIP/aquaporin family protein [Planctomycetota bacterium]